MPTSAEILNSLITINNDRIKGYETALEETKDADLKSLFSKFIQTSRAAKKELDAEVIKLGEEPENGTRLDGKIYRLWMDFKAAVTGKNRESILNSCEYGEEVALESYEDALEEEDLGTTYSSLIKSQMASIQMDYDRVKSLQEAE